MAQLKEFNQTAHDVFENEDKEYNIVISARRIKGTKQNGEDYDFLTFKGYEKSGKKCDFLFTKDCNDVPEEEGEYIIVVNKRYINKDKLSRYNRYWIKQLVSCDVYDGYYENEEDLDF